MDNLFQNDSKYEEYEKRYILTILISASIFIPVWHYLLLFPLEYWVVDTIYTRLALVSPYFFFFISSFFFRFHIEIYRKLFISLVFIMSTYFAFINFKNNYSPDICITYLLLILMCYVLSTNELVKKRLVIFVLVINSCFLFYYKIINNIVFVYDMAYIFLLCLINLFTLLLFSNPSLMKMKLEYERSKEQVFLMKKWAALGQMSGGVAHEINSPLNSAFLKVDLLKDKVKEDLFLSTKLDELKVVLERISKIIRSLKFLAKNESLDEIGEYRVIDIINEALDLSNFKFTRYKIEIRKTFDLPLDFSHELNQTNIIQVFLNLINNSVDAIKNQSERWIHIHVTKDEKCAFKIEFTDSGRGIPKEKIKGLFSLENKQSQEDKTEGLGLGLGLSLSKKIMEYHRGKIEYDPKSEYTKFTLTFYDIQRKDKVLAS